MKKKYSLLIFDWDGTIIDSTAHICKTVAYACAAEAVAYPGDSVVRASIGLSLEHAIAQVLPQATRDTVTAVVSQYRKRFHEVSDKPPLFDGARSVLTQLTSLGYTLAIATGKSRRGLDHDLQTHKLDNFFAYTRCADETRSKPDPLMLDELMHECQVACDNCLMIGDSEYDLLMAKSIGMDRLHAAYGAMNREFDAGLATDTLSDISNLIPWLGHTQ